MKRGTKISLWLTVFLLLCATLGVSNATQIEPSTPPIGPFVKYEGNPILLPQGVGFESKAVFNPAVIKDGETFYMLYRAEDWSGKGWWNGTSRIGLAYSDDGIHFERYPDNPVIGPEYDYEKPGGCEDPRLVKVDDTYYLTYTGYNGQTARLCLATSEDLIHWRKYGPIFSEWRWSKSGAILSEKINGEYIMYFGDSNIWIAYSDDLIHWEAEMEPVMRLRIGYFDSKLVEPGPPPIITDEGILLIYNGSDQQSRYSTGWVLFSKEDPTKVLRRANEPILEVTKDWEKFGKVYNVVFAEGLVEYEDTWYLYYGAADTYIAVVICEK